MSLLEEKGYNPLVYRLFCLQSHYRKPLTFSFDSLDNAAQAYQNAGPAHRRPVQGGPAG